MAKNSLQNDLKRPVEVVPFPPLLDALISSSRLDDEQLADWIGVDGRDRLARGEKINLADYLAAIPDLRSRLEPLDAAIDIALRSASGTGKADDFAVQFLVDSYPFLENEIRDAATLADALIATSEVTGSLGDPVSPEPPCNFGPILENGTTRYLLLNQLGSGTTASVYLATDRRLSDHERDAHVAIKLIAVQSKNRLFKSMFLEEAAKARRLEHSNAVSVLDCGLSPSGQPYIVYEHKPGGDLQQELDSGRRSFSSRECALLVSKIARATQAAHFAGLVHCDLKPGNILLDDQGEPYVADFGVAVRQSEQSELAEDDLKRPVGTVAFMSPEQYRMAPGALSPATDIYALGGVLYWMLTGAWPNGADAQEIRERLSAARESSVPGPSPRAIRSETPKPLDLICRKALASRPEERYVSAADLAEELENWLALRPIQSEKSRLPRRAWLLFRRRPALTSACAVAFLAVVGGAVAVTASSRYALIAERKDQEAALALERAELQKERAARAQLEVRLQEDQTDELQRRMMKAARRIGGMMIEYRKGVRTGFAAQAMAMYIAFEDVYNDPLMGDEYLRQWIADEKFESTRALIHDSRMNGGDTSIQALWWEYILGFWLIWDGRSGEAVPLLEQNLARWEAFLPPSDPFLTDVRAVLNCAHAASLIEDAKRGGYRKQSLKAAMRLDTELAASFTALESRYHAGRLCDLIERQRKKLRQSGLLPVGELFGPNEVEDPATQAASMAADG